MGEDQAAIDLEKNKNLLVAFARHAHVDDNCTANLVAWISAEGRARGTRHFYDRDSVQRLIVGGDLPRGMISRLADSLYQGNLNASVCKFVHLAAHDVVPSRFPLLL